MFHGRLEVLVRRVQKDMDEIGDSKIKSNLKIPSKIYEMLQRNN